MSVLSDERGPESVRLVAHHRKHLAKLTELVHELGVGDDPEVQRAVGSLYADGEAHRLYVNDLLSAIDNGTSSGLEGSIAKLLWSQETQELHHVAMDLLGASAITGEAEHWFERVPVVAARLDLWRHVADPEEPDRPALARHAASLRSTVSGQTIESARCT